MKIVITGANGLIGRIVANYLSKKNYIIFGMDVSDAGIPSTRFQLDGETNNPLLKQKFSGHYIKVDITKKADLKKYLSKIGNIDLIIHLAALMEVSPVEEIYQVNVVGTQNIYECAYELGISNIIYASSIQTVAKRLLTFSGDLSKIPKISPYERVANPQFPAIQAYVDSKFKGEDLAKTYFQLGISTVVMRIGAVSANDLPYVEKSLSPIWCSHHDLCSFVDKAVIKLQSMQLPFAQNYYVCSSHPCLWVDMSNDLDFIPKDNAEMVLQKKGKGSAAAFSVWATANNNSAAQNPLAFLLRQSRL